MFILDGSSALNNPVTIIGVAAIGFAALAYSVRVLATALGKKRNGNGHSAKPETSGDLPPAEWEKRIQAACVAAIRAELGIAIETIRSCTQRIEASVGKQSESQMAMAEKLIEAVNKLALAIKLAKGFGDD